MLDDNEEDRDKSTVLEQIGTSPKKLKSGSGYVVDMGRFRQLQGQRKVVNPYGSISKGVLGKEMLSENEQKEAFMLKKDYNQDSS